MAGIVALSLLIVAPAAQARVQDALAGGVESRGDQPAVSIGVCVAALAVLGLLWWKDVIRPGSLQRRAKRDPSGIPPLVWFTCAGIMFVVPAFGAGFALLLPSGALGSPGGVRHDGIVAMCGYGVALACAGFLLYLLAPRAAAAGLRFRWKDAAVGLATFALTLPVVLGVGVASTLIYTLITGEEPAAIAHSTLDQIREQRGNPWTIVIIVAAVIGAPIVEEITYRIFLQSAFVRVLVSRWGAILITSVIFALVHRIGPTPVPWHAIPAIFTLGLGCGIAYERTSRPGVPMMMHGAFNAFNVALVLLMT